MIMGNFGEQVMDLVRANVVDYLVRPAIVTVDWA